MKCKASNSSGTFLQKYRRTRTEIKTTFLYYYEEVLEQGYQIFVLAAFLYYYQEVLVTKRFQNRDTKLLYYQQFTLLPRGSRAKVPNFCIINSFLILLPRDSRARVPNFCIISNFLISLQKDSSYKEVLEQGYQTFVLLATYIVTKKLCGYEEVLEQRYQTFVLCQFFLKISSEFQRVTKLF